LGPEEIAQDQVALKDLTSGDQISVPSDEIVDKIRAMLAGQA
jgi:histidyl-tRNA synthetase